MQLRTTKSHQSSHSTVLWIYPVSRRSEVSFYLIQSSVGKRRTRMVNSEKLCLQWNEFQDVVSSSFGELRDDHDLADVTLACEDGKQVEAHKIILASCSPFFMGVFKRNKHTHPLMYMRGVTGEILEALVDFMYKGEANVDETNLQNFLGLAGELRLRGLDGTMKADEEFVSKVPQPPRETVNKRAAKPLRQIIPLMKSTSNPLLPLMNGTSSQKKEKPAEETKGWNLALNTGSSNEDLDNQIKSMMEKSESNVSGKLSGKARICKVCGKEGQMATIQAHIESNHITGVTHDCALCGSTKNNRDALRKHMYTKHKN